MMYRWHATLSEPDTAWITKKFEDMFPGKDLGQVSFFPNLVLRFACLDSVLTRGSELDSLRYS